MRSRKDDIPVFIQAMYGTIAGISFYKIAVPQPGPLRLVETWDELTTFLTSAPFFRFLFFALTLLVIAQDLRSKYQLKENTHTSYWHYLPQMLAIFCLSQMFVAVETLSLKYWYAYLFGHTICQAVSFSLQHKRTNKTKTAVQYLRFLINLFLAEILFFTIPFAFFWPTYLLALVVSTYILVFSWWLISED